MRKKWSFEPVGMRWFRPPGALARGTLGVIAWNGARILVQLIWIVMAARLLGADGYGLFSGIAGLAVTIGGFIGLGMGLRMYQDVAREPTLFATRWSQACSGMVLSFLPLGACYLLLSAVIFPGLDWGVLLLIGGAELLGAPLVSLVAFAYAAKGRVVLAAAVPVAMAGARVLAVVAMMAIQPHPDLRSYAWLHVLMTGTAAFCMLIGAARLLDANWQPSRLSWSDIKSGLGFSSLWASGLAFGSFDKTLALRYSSAVEAGTYAASQRFASIVAMPVEALVSAALPRLFRDGAGMREHPRLLPMLFLATLTYGMAAGACLWWSAGALVWVLGPAFESTIGVTKILALYVPLYCMRILAAHVLLSRGAVRYRVMSEIIAIATMALTMSQWVSRDGAMGAAKAILATELTLVLLFSFGIYLRRRFPH